MRRPRRGVVVLLAGVLALGVVILIGSGWRGLAVYAFLAGFAALVAFGAGVGGDFLTSASRGRFERDDRR